jgi:hypothetical protein
MFGWQEVGQQYQGLEVGTIEARIHSHVSCALSQSAMTYQNTQYGTHDAHAHTTDGSSTHIDCVPGGVLQLRCKGDGRALLCRQALVSPEQPHKAATLLNLRTAAAAAASELSETEQPHKAALILNLSSR